MHRQKLDLRFSLFYSPEQFAQTFAHLVAGDFDVAPLLTGSVGPMAWPMPSNGCNRILATRRSSSIRHDRKAPKCVP